MGLFDQQQMTKPDIRIDSGYQPQVGQGLMGLGQQPQGNQPQMTFLPPQETSNPFATGGGLPMPQNPNYMGMSDAPFNPAMGMPQGNMPPMPQSGMPQIGVPLGRFIPATGLPDGIINSEGGSYEYPQPPQAPYNNGKTRYGIYGSDSVMPQGYPQPSTKFLDRYDMTPQARPLQSFFEGPTKGQIPMGFQMVNGELVNMGFNDDSGRKPYVEGLSTTPALNSTPQPSQIFQTPMQQQPSNPVNTQTVQPNFMGQTPFGQAQTGQFTSTNPFVQAAQANAQGNLSGALQATAANRINQQTPYGSLSYQQTGTDAQGNPIWSANQNLSPELQNLTQSSLAGLQASQANPMYGINPGDTYSNAIMQRLAPQQSQAREALDAQLANQGIMPGSEAYNRAKTLLGQTQNDALTSAIVGGMQTGLQAQGLQNTTAANIRNLATPGYVTPYNQATVAGPDYLSAYTSQNATDIARANAEAAQRSSLLSTLGGLGSSAILGGTGANSALGGLLGLGSKGLESLGNSSLWTQLFGGGAPAITGDTNYLNSIGLGGSTYGSGIGGMTTDPLAGLYTQPSTPEDLSYLFNSSFGYDF
jgi:hypothetical protein